MTAPDNWYYSRQGAPTGPVARAELESMICAGSLGPDTPVWSGSGDWIPARSSPLGWMFAGSAGSTPMPPAFTSVAQLAPQGKYESFVFDVLAPCLEPGERFQLTAVVFTGELTAYFLYGSVFTWSTLVFNLLGRALLKPFLRFHKFYFAVATDRRLFLVETRMGSESLKALNLGTRFISYDTIARVSTGGTPERRTTTLSTNTGKSLVLRLHSAGELMSGQRHFQDRFPQLVQQRRSAS